VLDIFDSDVRAIKHDQHQFYVELHLCYNGQRSFSIISCLASAIAMYSLRLSTQGLPGWGGLLRVQYHKHSV